MFITMRFLELKIPPGPLALLIAIVMWGMSRGTQTIELSTFVRFSAAGFFILAGAVASIAGVITFRRFRTTVNPLQPNSASALVCNGVYGFSRNPMYLGFLLILIGWAAILANALTFLGPLIFVLYMNRFQIAPEEKALAVKFGTEFYEYRNRVRRWL